MKIKNSVFFLFLVILIALAARGVLVILRGDSASVHYEVNGEDLPVLDIYTLGGATTPQLALFASIREGEFGSLFNFRIHVLKNPDDLMTSVMAGKGDLWIGHTDGFAVARLRGAPVKMIVFTSFRKFYILTSSTAVSWRDLDGTTAAYAPPGSPAFHLLEKVMDKTHVRVKLEPYQGRELELLMASGKIKTAVLPEPVATLILSGNSEIRVLANVEELFCSVTGSAERIPVAGIAVNEKTAGLYPEKIAALQGIIVNRSAILERDGGKAARYFPEYFYKYIPPEIVEKSLERDIISAEKGGDMERELSGYLYAVHPEMFRDINMKEWCTDFLWR